MGMAHGYLQAACGLRATADPGRQSFRGFAGWAEVASNTRHDLLSLSLCYIERVLVVQKVC